jgi:NADPH:quinone reductase-like Zn-dependent oxidoreductase
MRAIRVSTPGGLDAIEVADVAEPAPPKGWHTMDVKAAGVNHLDLWVRRGLPIARYPITLGSDAAGIVRETGKRALLDPGFGCGLCEFCVAGEKSLCPKYRILGEHLDGAQADVVVAPAENFVEIPDGLSYVDAAAVPLVGLTAWRMLVTRARLRPGEDVLVWSAGAGVGTACVLIARLLGARVIATASSAAKAAKLAALGADVVLDASTDDAVARVRELTGKRGVDVVVDYIGKDTWSKSLQLARRGGRIVTCGATSGPDPVEGLRHVFFRQLEILGSTMGTAAELRSVLSHVFSGRLRIPVDAVLPLKEAREAHRRLESRSVFGKIVLEP